jgi:hypothetical protein
MKTFADIKRRLNVGVSLTMVRHDWYPTNKLMNNPRKIITRQVNAIEFENGSWLHFPKANEVRIVSDNAFEVKLNPDEDVWMGYQFN